MNDRSRLGLVLVSLGLALMLWRGSFFHSGQYALAALGVAAVLLVRPSPSWRDPILWALVTMAAANLAAAAVADRASAWAPALAVCALPALYAVVRELNPADRRLLLLSVAGVATAASAAGVLAYALRATPDAQHIDGVWRAAGAFEYPPALAIVSVCGIAAVCALTASAVLGRAPALALVAVLASGLVLSFDRAGLAMGVAVAVIFAVRVPATRGLWPAAAAGLLVAAALVAIHPPHSGKLSGHLQHGLLSGRSGVWSDAWEAFERRPVEGYGPGGFARIYLGKVGAGSAGLAHDLPLEQAVEAGAVAAAAAVVLVVAVFLRCGRGLARRDPISIAYACIGLGIVVSGLYDFTWSFAGLALLGVVGAAGVIDSPAEA